MTRILIWDLPTRLFHWFLASGFVAAAVIALWLGEHSRLFPYHAIIGLTIALMICLRVVWGLLGTRYARFSSFVFGPQAVIKYMKGVLLGGGSRHIGHNPGSAYAIFIMLALVISLAATGILMGRGNEGVKDLHEILAYSLAAVAIAHILGVVLHTLRYRENITASMVHGRKEAEPNDGIRSSRPIVAIVFLVIAGAWSFGLIHNFEAATQTTKLPLIGTSLQLGEVEKNVGSKHESGNRRHKNVDDDD